MTSSYNKTFFQEQKDVSFFQPALHLFYLKPGTYPDLKPRWLSWTTNCPSMLTSLQQPTITDTLSTTSGGSYRPRRRLRFRSTWVPTDSLTVLLFHTSRTRLNHTPALCISQSDCCSFTANRTQVTLNKNTFLQYIKNVSPVRSSFFVRGKSVYRSQIALHCSTAAKLGLICVRGEKERKTEERIGVCGTVPWT